MSNTTDKLGGKVKQAVGKVTDDEELEAEGKVEETKGEVKDNLKHVADKISNAINEKK